MASKDFVIGMMMKKRGRKDKKCPICMEKIEDEETFRFGCDHETCETCVFKSWMLKHDRNENIETGFKIQCQICKFEENVSKNTERWCRNQKCRTMASEELKVIEDNIDGWCRETGSNKTDAMRMMRTHAGTASKYRTIVHRIAIFVKELRKHYTNNECVEEIVRKLVKVSERTEELKARFLRAINISE